MIQLTNVQYELFMTVKDGQPFWDYKISNKLSLSKGVFHRIMRAFKREGWVEFVKTGLQGRKEWRVTQKGLDAFNDQLDIWQKRVKENRFNL